MDNHVKRAAFLSGKQQELIERKSTLMNESSKAQEIVDMHKPVLTRLEELQTKAVHQSAGVYNELLTAIVHDVMQDIDQTIELKTEVKHNKPQLFIDSKKQGLTEDIVTDRGGSINNLISAGLRFISIVQSGNRRFVAMDEQDCWLEERLVPRFIEVLDKLCKEIGVQCVFISHHDREIMQDKCQVVELNSKQGNIEPIISQANTTDSNIEHKMGGEWFADTGLQFIELNNVMSHTQSNIPLSSSMTALVGGNDIGKSVVIRAIDAFKNNKPYLSLIRHGEKQASVKVGLEGGMELHWSIEKNKSGKKLEAPQYTLFDENKKIVKTASSSIGVVPPWVDDLLAMGQHDKMDAHIGHQKDPLFILNPAITPAQRAEMVDLGQEFHVVQKMFELHNENMKGARATIKRNKAEIDMVNKRLEQLSVLNVVNVIIDGTEKNKLQLQVDTDNIDAVERSLAYLKASNLDKDILSQLKKAAELDHKGKVIDTAAASQLINILNSSTIDTKALDKVSLLSRNVSESLVDVKRAEQIKNVLTSDTSLQTELLEKLSSMLSINPQPVTTKASGALKVLDQHQTLVEQAKLEADNAKKAQVAVNDKWDEAVKHHGSSCPCPTCGQTLAPSPF